MRNPAVLEEIIALYRRRGGATYGEGVTQTEHALQSALLAEQAGAGPTLVTAALLHDIGHLLHDLGEDIADRGIDAEHESIASAWLSQHFPPAVSEPVRLHVAAKRYLCTAEAGYHDRLSPASQQSLALQGGPMSAAEAAAFRAEPYAADAVALRHWDDEAKLVGRPTPDLEHYRPIIAAALKA